MKNKTLTKKLSLNKKTVSNLEMAAVKGGIKDTQLTWCLCTVDTGCWTCGHPVSYCICPE